MDRSDYFGKATEILHYVVDGNTNILEGVFLSYWFKSAYRLVAKWHLLYFITLTK